MLARELPTWPDTIIGATHLRSLPKWLGELRQNQPHGNRSLFLDDVFVASLLAFFNPTLRTLRTIEDFSQTRQAQKHLWIPKLCKSTVSDFNKLADPEPLQPILDHLRREILKPGPGQPRLADPLLDLHRKILAVDGTFLSERFWPFPAPRKRLCECMRGDGPHQSGRNPREPSGRAKVGRSACEIIAELQIPDTIASPAGASPHLPRPKHFAILLAGVARRLTSPGAARRVAAWRGILFGSTAPMPKETPMPTSRFAPRLCLLVVAVSCLPGPAETALGDAFSDERYGFRLEVPAPWAEAPLSSYAVPGVVRAAWSGPAGSSIVAFVQEPGSAANPRTLVDDGSKVMKEKLGCSVKAAEVRSVDGKKAMWIVATGKGTGGALTGQGDVETSSHWVAIPREKDVIVVLLTCPATDYDERRPSFEKAIQTMKIQGTQTPEQAESK